MYLHVPGESLSGRGGVIVLLADDAVDPQELENADSSLATLRLSAAVTALADASLI